MLGRCSHRRIASVALALMMIGSVVGVGGVGTAAANTDVVVTTESATDVTTTGATLQGNLSELGDDESATVYFTYWKAGQKDETLTWWTGDERSTPGTFAAEVALDAGTTYEYRAYAQADDGTWKAGSVREVTTDGRPFAVETGGATDVASSAATVNGNLTGLGGADSATVYVEYWAKGDDSTTYWWTGEERSAPGSFTADLGLAPGTTYEYRTLAQSSDGEWTAGAVREVTTPDAGFGVTTTPASSVETGSATIGGNLTSLGGADSATVYVEYWREGLKESTTYWWTGDARTAPGAFETTLDLRAGTTYEYRALAQSSDGEWAAGAVESFTTEGNPFEVATALPQNVTHDSATATAELFGVGDADSATVYLRYWEQDRESETATWKTGPTVSGPTEFTESLDLRSETTYNVRAFAQDADGEWTAGRVHTFRTEAAPGDGEPPLATFDYGLSAEPPTFEHSAPYDVADAVTFDARESSDPDGEIVSYEWDFDGDREADATGAVVDHSFDSPGNHDVRLTVTDDDGNSRSYDLTVHVGDHIADAVHRVNAGGLAVERDDGPDWKPDSEGSPSAYANHDESDSRVIEADRTFRRYDVTPEGEKAPLSAFESNREDPDSGEGMRYSFDVEQGETYEVRVYVSELEVTGDSYDEGERRIFDVTVDGQTVAEDFDTYAEYGNHGGGVKTATVTAEDGTLTVEFHREQGDPVVAAIEILRVGEDDGN